MRRRAAEQEGFALQASRVSRGPKVGSKVCLHTLRVLPLWFPFPDFAVVCFKCPRQLAIHAYIAHLEVLGPFYRATSQLQGTVDLNK